MAGSAADSSEPATDTLSAWNLPAVSLPSRAPGSVENAVPADFHWFARRLAHAAGFRIDQLQRTPEVDRHSRSPRPRLVGYVGGERNVRRDPVGQRQSRAIGVTLFAAATVTFAALTLSRVGNLSLSQSVQVGFVVGAPFWVAGVYLLLGASQIFRSEILCIAYEGPSPSPEAEEVGQSPTTLTVTIATGSVRSKVYSGKRLSGRAIQRVLGPGDTTLATLPTDLIAKLVPGTRLPRVPVDQEDDGFD
jgi:hypothetical protein